jgi:hypothetical protein
MRLVWLQQDGATSHTARISMQTFQEMFSGHVTLRNGDVAWLPPLPDLSPCDCFLWECLKAQGVQESTSQHLQVVGFHQDYRSANSSGHVEEDNGLCQASCRGLFTEQRAHLTDVVFKK